MRYPVPPEAAGLTLGRFLYDRLRLSRNLVRKAKTAGGLLVDGLPARTSRELTGGETVELVVEAEGRVTPEPLALNIAYEDHELLVVDKPPGLLIHPVRSHVSGTLANGVAQHLLERGEPPVARPVQRIDRDTSGLVLWAKNPAVAGQLAAELERNKLERRYLALATGRLEGEGTIAVPIRRVWGHPVAREAAVGPRTAEQEAQLAEAAAQGTALHADWTGAGQRAVTHWRALQPLRGATLLELRLETGRTHQIRVHLAHLGHPLLGDELYGQGGPPGRQALHAAALALRHPVSGEWLRLSSPLPVDLAELLRDLESR